MTDGADTYGRLQPEIPIDLLKSPQADIENHYLARHHQAPLTDDRYQLNYLSP